MSCAVSTSTITPPRLPCYGTTRRSIVGDLLREFIGQQNNMYVICGDRHWQYISKHTESGILEYGCGAATDEHATALQNPDHSMHLYYGHEKGGFLSVTIDRISGTPTAFMRHHGVMGDLLNENIQVAPK